MAVKNGVRLPVSFGEVFPHGCLMVPGSVGPVEDYDERTKNRTPAVDKLTGERVWSLRVIDLDPELGTRPRETVVKVTRQRLSEHDTRSRRRRRRSVEPNGREYRANAQFPCPSGKEIERRRRISRCYPDRKGERDNSRAAGRPCGSFGVGYGTSRHGRQGRSTRRQPARR